MRIFSSSFNENISKLYPVIYLFEIALKDGSTLHLTSASSPVSFGEVTILPKSGLTFEEAVFDESAQNYIILSGVFEEGGLDKRSDLTEASFKIILYCNKHFEHLLTYRCSSFTSEDLRFTLRLEPESKKYHQSVVQSFSKTCRANFGDRRCRVNKMLHIYQYRIIEIRGKVVIVSNMDKEDGYFLGGDAFFQEPVLSFKILGHFQNKIEMGSPLPEKIKSNYLITLIAGCDKKFITCCNKFNNAVNFRGEPFIPDHNFLNMGNFQ